MQKYPIFARQSEYYKLKRLDDHIPVRWTAPEILEGGNATTRSDVYSFGVVMWEILELGAQPFREIATSQLREHILQGNVLPAPKSHPSEKLYSLILHCCSQKSDNRPTFNALGNSLRQILDEGNKN